MQPKFSLSVGDADALAAAGRAVTEGLLEPGPYKDGGADGRAVLTLRGRLLADAVVRDLVD